MFLTGLIVFLVAVAIMVAMCYALLLVFKMSIVFSKAAVALIIATAFSSSTPLLSNGFLNYVVWAAICLAVFFLICRLPRIDCALEFFCKLCACYIVGLLLTFGLIDTVFKLELSTGWRLAIEIGVRLVAVFMAASSTYQRIMEVDIRKFSNVIVVNIDRLVASFLYGFSCGAMVVGNLPVAVPELVTVAVLIGFILIAFIVDCIYISKKL